MKVRPLSGRPKKTDDDERDDKAALHEDVTKLKEDRSTDYRRVQARSELEDANESHTASCSIFYRSCEAKCQTVQRARGRVNISYKTRSEGQPSSAFSSTNQRLRNLASHRQTSETGRQTLRWKTPRKVQTCGTPVRTSLSRGNEGSIFAYVLVGSPMQSWHFQ